jgi:rhodanese-related sulfurtransferase
LIDIRPAEKFQLYNIVGTTNVPASTFKPEQVADVREIP